MSNCHRPIPRLKSAVVGVKRALYLAGFFFLAPIDTRTGHGLSILCLEIEDRLVLNFICACTDQTGILGIPGPYYPTCIGPRLKSDVFKAAIAHWASTPDGFVGGKKCLLPNYNTAVGLLFLLIFPTFAKRT